MVGLLPLAATTPIRPADHPGRGCPSVAARLRWFLSQQAASTADVVGRAARSGTASSTRLLSMVGPEQLRAHPRA